MVCTVWQIGPLLVTNIPISWVGHAFWIEMMLFTQLGLSILVYPKHFWYPFWFGWPSVLETPRACFLPNSIQPVPSQTIEIHRLKFLSQHHSRPWMPQESTNCFRFWKSTRSPPGFLCRIASPIVFQTMDDPMVSRLLDLSVQAVTTNCFSRVAMRF